MANIPTTQQALLLLSKETRDFAVDTIPVPRPGKDEVLVKIHSSGLNPGEWRLTTDEFIDFLAEFPAVLGLDISGEIVQVGEGVTQWAIGDKVFFQGIMNNKYAGYQQYTLADAHSIARIPENVSYDEAAGLNVPICGSYVGLYQAEPHGLGFESPLTKEGRGKYAGKPILILGGATSCGQYAIQLAKLSGFSPILTTASPRHTAYLQSIGATHVLDRNTPLSESLPAAIPIDTVLNAVGSDSTTLEACEILAPGGRISSLNPNSPKGLPERAKAEGKKIIGAFGAKQFPPVYDCLKGLYEGLTKLLEEGNIKFNEIEVLPGGLYGIPGGLRRLREGSISKLKLIVHPQETSASIPTA